MVDFSAEFTVALPYIEFLARHGTDEHRQRWVRVHNTVALNDAQRALLASFKRQMNVLCLAGAWCGDCVNQCPIFDHFAAATPMINLRFADRDARAELASSLKICGGTRVPVVVFLSEDDQFVGQYGDRTLSRYRELAASADGAACPTGIGGPAISSLQAAAQDWLNEFERVQCLLRTSSRLRQKHGD